MQTFSNGWPLSSNLTRISSIPVCLQEPIMWLFSLLHLHDLSQLSIQWQKHMANVPCIPNMLPHWESFTPPLSKELFCEQFTQSHRQPCPKNQHHAPDVMIMDDNNNNN